MESLDITKSKLKDTNTHIFMYFGTGLDLGGEKSIALLKCLVVKFKTTISYLDEILLKNLPTRKLYFFQYING